MSLSTLEQEVGGVATEVVFPDNEVFMISGQGPDLYKKSRLVSTVISLITDTPSFSHG